MNKTPIRIGLTGGIGSGKSSTCKFFKELNVPVISADEITRELVKANQPVFADIIEKFGEDFISKSGLLDRAKLRQHIFTNPLDRQWLESILHPLVREKIDMQTQKIEYPYCIIEIPLLIENNLQSFVDKILIVDCHESLQIKRACKRDKCSPVQIEAIIKNQASRSQRIAASDYILLNDGNLNNLKHLAETYHHQFLALSLP